MILREGNFNLRNCKKLKVSKCGKYNGWSAVLIAFVKLSAHCIELARHDYQNVLFKNQCVFQNEVVNCTTQNSLRKTKELISALE